jgi:hypothetical protein
MKFCVIQMLETLPGTVQILGLASFANQRYHGGVI